MNLSENKKQPNQDEKKGIIQKKHKIKISTILISMIAIVSLLANGVQYLMKITDTINQTNANSRDNYFSLHHVREAHQISKGGGVKVGVIDSYFALSDNADLYSGGEDFAGNEDALMKAKSHGWQMSVVLREIAPECDIYALNISHENEDKMVDSLVAAIEWAKENHLDVLTLSQAQISEGNRERFNQAIDQAAEQGIVTTFIHCSNQNNLLPYSISPYMGDYDREPDINVFQYDYNAIRTEQLRSYAARTTPVDSGNDMPFFSYSSMSPVTAGFVAILKSIDHTLTPAECKQILIDTSYEMEYSGGMSWESGISPHTVDIYKAAQFVKDGHKR